jgi:hypothetical protein
MSFVQLIYCSARNQNAGNEKQMLDSIMNSAVRINLENGITGCLGYNKEWYLQVLEGEQSMVDETYGRIAGDNRHSNVTKLLTREIRNRSFPEWSMLAVQLAQEPAALGGGSPISPLTTPPLQLLMWLMNLTDSVRLNRTLPRLY